LESSSEDTFASYAIKMWGKVTGDGNMEARGNLMLAIEARALSSYFLMQSDNTIQPADYIGNKADGILFENKADHTTYFGTNIEYIEGIHMIPLMPNSGLTRAAKFVTEEWNTYFSNGRVDSIAGGWKGVLYANLALVDAKSSWNFFSSSSFNSASLDGGASLSWYLTYAAALGGL
jgi:endo-1,3(4)-beta-glucanase